MASGLLVVKWPSAIQVFELGPEKAAPDPVLVALGKEDQPRPLVNERVNGLVGSLSSESSHSGSPTGLSGPSHQQALDVEPSRSFTGSSGLRTLTLAGSLDPLFINDLTSWVVFGPGGYR